MLEHYTHNALNEIAHTLGLEFTNVELLGQALVHRSTRSDSTILTRGSNERLEFLGDAVLGMAVTEELVSRYPQWDENRLSHARMLLVKNSHLADVSSALRLHSWLVMRGGNQASTKAGAKTLADVLEAVIGATFLDQGYDSARDWVVRIRGDAFEESGVSFEQDPIAVLSHLAKTLDYPPPVYRRVKMGSRKGHAYTVEVTLDGQVLAMGHGQNRSEATFHGARKALRSWRG